MSVQRYQNAVKEQLAKDRLKFAKSSGFGQTSTASLLHAILHANLEICGILAILEKRKSLFPLFLGFSTILTRWKSQVRIPRRFHGGSLARVAQIDSQTRPSQWLSNLLAF
jgi:hypothetical protein